MDCGCVIVVTGPACYTVETCGRHRRRGWDKETGQITPWRVELDAMLDQQRQRRDLLAWVRRLRRRPDLRGRWTKIRDAELVVCALRVAAQTSNRSDLRPHYQRLADELAEFLVGPDLEDDRA